jgi:hypothetical protein
VLHPGDVLGGEPWVGANDGRWHGAARDLGRNISVTSRAGPGATRGIVWIDDIVVIPDDPSR